MQFDEIYEYLGHLGIYQVCIVTIACMLSMFDAEAVTMVFVGGSMDHCCRVSELTNLSYTEQKSLAIPYTDGEYSSCQMYDCNYTLISGGGGGGLVENCTQERVVDCASWIYDQSTFVSTIVSKVSIQG